MSQTSPVSESEPVAYQFRQRSAVGKGPQCSLPWCDWVSIEREDYDLYVRHPNPLVEVRPLYAGHAQCQQVPEGFVLVPRELTAENGAKSALIGEFSETFDYMDDEGDECQAEIPVSWTTIKEIHKKMVALFALTDTSTGREGKVNPVCDTQALLEIRDFLQDIVGGAEITERSRDAATGFVSILDSQFGAVWSSVTSPVQTPQESASE